MSVFTDLLEKALPIVLSGAKKIADAKVDGALLNKDQKQALYAGYVVIQVYGDDLVESTENEFDDAGLDALAEFCVDTLDEAGVTVPIIPDELLED